MIKRILSVLLCLVMLCSLLVLPPVSAEESLPFTDVPVGSWYYDAVKYVYDIGIMNGTNAAGTLFSPDVTVTRAMFVAMLGRLHGAEQKSTDKFPDVDSVGGSWYAGYVGWASENGIITGYDNGNFGPSDPVTREQMAVIIMRYVDYLGILPTYSISAPYQFTDIGEVGSWAVKFVEEMRMIGIIQGNAQSQFSPKDGLGRSSAATIIMRLDRLLKNIELGDAINPDYTVDNGAFALMGAYDLYYGGTALDFSYDSVKVAVKDGYPYLTASDDGQKWIISNSSGRETFVNGEPTFGELKEQNDLATNNFFEVDLKIACIDPEKYPVLRVAYRADAAKDVKLGIFSDKNTSDYIPFTPKADKLSGWSYAIVDIKDCGMWSVGSEAIVATLASEANLELLYFAAFPDKASAEAFDVTGYKDEIDSYDGEAVKMLAASKAGVDAALAEADAAAQAIINNPDNVDTSKITGSCYYVSDSEGDDSNPGTSPDKPWKTFSNLYIIKGGGAVIQSKVKAGDAVLLKRGDTFNYNSYPELKYNYIDTVPGVTYGTYGEGPKPVISREFVMNEPAGKWSKTSYANVWKLDYTMTDFPGCIVFDKPDGTELWGIITVFNDPQAPYGTKSRSLGTITNGEDVFKSGSVLFENPGALKNNLEYFVDPDTDTLYVYYDKGNPGDVFSEIHMSMSQTGMSNDSSPAKKSTIPTVVDNIAFKYIGACAIGIGEAENYYVTNCTFEWIGGAFQGGNDSVRFGNAIQNWGNCDGIFVLDCYFRDIYDAAVTTQGNGGIMVNFYSDGCVLDRCDLSFEFFNHGDTSLSEERELSNIILTNNYVINNGVGFCNVRTDRRSAFLYTTYGTNNTNYRNIVYENNVNVFSAEFAIFSAEIALGQTEGTILRNNVYYMDPTVSYFGKFAYNMIDRTGQTKTLYPYSSQYLTYLNSLGVEVGSTFYVTENPDLSGNR